MTRFAMSATLWKDFWREVWNESGSERDDSLVTRDDMTGYVLGTSVVGVRRLGCDKSVAAAW
eukprot:CAMPEP_0194298682 /NCGR_PEP_ID=MMETSP0169-20130528/60301_1 /TAXON_ID=218684 /ORGANISM="Corethron pennatum, Strain L29A3" /LENGTH=61 /DNA_ID=CAMNT_0039048693 /DNA_START=441 /DNA_END=626 /DNA_ORIENTATION=-